MKYEKTDIKYYQDLATRMINNDRDRDTANTAYDAMDHNEWVLPSRVKTEMPWVKKVVSTDPHDALEAGERVISALEPSIRVQPTHDNTETKDLANERERNLRFQLKAADRRKKGGTVSAMARSALKYDEIIVNVVDLDYQIEQKELFGGDTKREKAARRYGRFLVNCYNPSDVHVRYSDLMPEAVLLVVTKQAQNVIDEWGAKAQELESLTYSENSEVTLYDYTDYDYRAVWAVPKDAGSGSDIVVIVPPGEHKIPFLTWVALVGGSTMEHGEVHKRRPILYSEYTSGRWHTQNMVKSLYASEVISRAAAARLIQEGNPAQDVEVDSGDIHAVLKAPVGTTVRPVPPPPIDTALSEIDDRLSAGTEKSTVSRILQGGDIPAGMAFATLNMATQTAIGALKPPKLLVEKALAEVFMLMLLWVEFSGKALDAYGMEDKVDVGAQYTIEPDEIQTDALFIEVELTPDVPTDRQQRGNTAAVLVEAIDYPIEMALEDVGVTDPAMAQRQRVKERLMQAKVETYIQEQQMAVQIKAQQAQMQMQMQAQAMQQQGPAPGQQAPPQGGMRPGGNGMPGGMGANPAMGGLPPAMSNPNVTRETVTGQTRTGEPIEEGQI